MRAADIMGLDLGWYDSSVFNPASVTPVLRTLADDGVRLSRMYTTTTTTTLSFHCLARCLLGFLRPGALLVFCLFSALRSRCRYAYKYCSPTRRSFLSGRYPVHISGNLAAARALRIAGRHRPPPGALAPSDARANRQGGWVGRD